MGRTPEGHQVRLMKMYGISRLLLQELAMLFCVQNVKVTGSGLGIGVQPRLMLASLQLVQVHANDLYSWPEDTPNLNPNPDPSP